MATKEEMLFEADRRGLLTGEKKAQFDEALQRGLLVKDRDVPSVPVPLTPEQQEASKRRGISRGEVERELTGAAQALAGPLAGPIILPFAKAITPGANAVVRVGNKVVSLAKAVAASKKAGVAWKLTKKGLFWSGAVPAGGALFEVGRRKAIQLLGLEEE